MSFVSSFRDPAGFCFAHGQKILRVVTPESLAEFEAFLATASARQFVEQGKVVSTRKFSAAEVEQFRQDPVLKGKLDAVEIGGIYEHERISFPSYPYEWPPEMLSAAGELTLELAAKSLREGFGVKDATPYNVLFRGPEPVFIDLLSFEKRQAGDALWKPYAQFVRTFLLPLLVNQRFGMRPADIFVSRRDGLEPEEVYRMCGPVQKLLPPWLTLVSFPAWLSGKGEKPSLYESKPLSDPEKAQFILEGMFGRLRRALKKFAPAGEGESNWSGYMETKSYSKERFATKEQFVQEFLKEAHPARVLDVGANTGHFSMLSAQAGAQVVAIDYDAACMGRLWQQARAKKLDILPLVVDLARPSAGLGWRNRECPGFLDRAEGAFEGILMLAVLHHLMVTERVPLDEVVELAATLTTRWWVVEFVGTGDEMFRRIARGRESLFKGLDEKCLEKAGAKYFEMVRKAHLGGERWLYLFRKK